MARTNIKNGDLLVDRPLPWNVYDTNGTLIHPSGSVIDEVTKGTLIKRGVLRDVDAEIGKLTRLVPDAQGEKADPLKGAKLPFSETSVRPGDTIHIDRSLDGTRITARMVGYLKGRSIIITIPIDEQGQIFLKEGESIIAKVFSGKYVLVFPATVLAVVSKPYPHIHFSYPSVVTGFIVRKSERASVRVIATIEAEGDSVAGIITDLSTGGVSFVTRNADIRPGSEVLLNFKIALAESTFIMKLTCLVRAVRDKQPDVLEGATGYGAQFRNLSAEDILILGLFVGHKMTETRSAGT